MQKKMKNESHRTSVSQHGSQKLTQFCTLTVVASQSDMAQTCTPLYHDHGSATHTCMHLRERESKLSRIALVLTSTATKASSTLAVG